jgi:hypothetical protein
LKIFHNIRKAGNRAAHLGEGTSEEASILLRQASRLGSWFVERYVENNGGEQQKPITPLYTSPSSHGFQRTTESVISKLFFRSLGLFGRILSLILIGSIAGIGTAFCVAIFYIIQMWLRRKLHRNGYCTTGWTKLTLFCVLLISVLGGVIHYTNTNTGTETETSKYTHTVASEDISINLSLKDYDAKIYINDKPVDTNTTDDYLVITANVGSKVHTEWTFPWGKMKSDTQQVKEGSESMEFQPKADPQLRKQLINFFNEFAKQCIQSKIEDNRDEQVTLVSGSVDYTCWDVSYDKNEKLIETGIDFKNSKPEIEEPAFSDPYLMFMLKAYFRYEVNGETETHHGGFRLVYDETKKSWSIKNEKIDWGEYKGNSEAVITEFE